METNEQAHYQVRFGRGEEALAALGRSADVVIWVDALPAVPAPGEPLAPVGLPRGLQGSGVAPPGGAPRPGEVPPPGGAALSGGAPIIHADLTTCVRAAEWMLGQQVAAGARVSVAVIAADETVEDTLAAGAVIDALAARGIDFSSPDAAVVCASFTGLRGAVAHLLSASTTGRALAEAGHGEIVARASEVEAAAGGIDYVA